MLFSAFISICYPSGTLQLIIVEKYLIKITLLCKKTTLIIVGDLSASTVGWL